MLPAESDREITAAATLDELPASSADVHAEDEREIAAALGSSAPLGSHASGTDGARPTNRELLAEIGSREPHADRPVELQRRERRFVRWLLVATFLACATLLASLWWLDPISVTGRQTRFSVVENGGVRQAKLDLMQELDAPPDVLVLGSSRSMKLDPAEIERVSGATAFNGAVSGGTTQDMYLYARYADELWGDEQYPHLVLGVVHDVFRYTGTAALDPRLKRFLPRKDRERKPLEVADQLLQLKTVEAGARAVRRIVPRDGFSALLHPTEGVGRHDASLATTGKQKSNQRENLSPRGMQLFDPIGDYSKPLAARVETHMTTFVKNSYTADPDYTGMDDRGLDLLVRTIRLANSHGDVPTLWVTPFQPGAIQYLPKDEYARRDEKFRDTIRTLQRDKTLRFEFVDFADIDAFEGDPDEFHDGIHMTPKNTAKVVAKLDELGLLAPRRR
jgi:hypothetical protein